MAHPPPTYELGLIKSQCSLIHTTSGRTMLLTTDHRTAALTDPVVIANTLIEAIVDMIAPQLDNQVQIGPLAVRVGTGTDVPAIGISTGALSNGAAASNSQPPNCNVLVKKGTGFAGRRNRGRMYLPWMIDEVNCDELGNINPASVAGLQPLFDAAVADMLAADVRMVIGNKTISIPLPPAKPFVTGYQFGPDVTTLTVESVIASQRRRLGR
jgi:hypothetical protein